MQSARLAPMVGVMLARRILLATIATTALLAPAAGAAPRRAPAALSPLESGVLGDINAFRQAHDLQPLRVNPRLNAAAREHTLQMAADGYFAHESADGSAFWKRIQAFYSTGASAYWSVGENLLWSSPNVTPAQALRWWLASPEHRANLMNPRWREIGVAAVHEPDAPGVYEGREVTIVTTDFGVRR
jgi:uncharacterized protein YkwD